jgi:methionyl-tRNA synthetase
MTRVDPKQIAALVEANKASLAPAPEAAPQKHAEKQEKAVARSRCGKPPPKRPHTSASTTS